ncbi:hypothetical protein ACQP2F_14560 [Actinoplanes sp. CA-030573]|uniref:hypothetical protein n=1 Tax=Actinoplanes sp. CA-030573 TaxID=3239898 RepID=UPI003D8B01EE
MDRIDTAKVPERLPRPAAGGDVAKVLAAISPRRPRKDLPLDRPSDRMLFETIYVCGVRAGEIRGLHIEDVDLRLDDGHVRITARAAPSAPVLLDDRGYVALLKALPATYRRLSRSQCGIRTAALQTRRVAPDQVVDLPRTNPVAKQRRGCAEWQKTDLRGIG